MPQTIKVSSLKEVFSVEGAVKLEPNTKYLVKVLPDTPERYMAQLHEYLRREGIDAVIVPAELEFYRIEN